VPTGGNGAVEGAAAAFVAAVAMGVEAVGAPEALVTTDFDLPDNPLVVFTTFYDVDSFFFSMTFSSRFLGFLGSSQSFFYYSYSGAACFFTGVFAAIS